MGPDARQKTRSTHSLSLSLSVRVTHTHKFARGWWCERVWSATEELLRSLGTVHTHTAHTARKKAAERTAAAIGRWWGCWPGGRGKGFKLQLASYPTLPSLPPWAGAAGTPWADREREREVGDGEWKKGFKVNIAGWVGREYTGT